MNKRPRHRLALLLAGVMFGNGLAFSWLIVLGKVDVYPAITFALVTFLIGILAALTASPSKKEATDG